MNWAKLQEQFVGLPVAKRARHGIHFKRADGLIEANFTGKPCHYLDAGLWKPIDTKLVLLSDGFYGCPHSKVKVHPDGRAAVAGTDYAQRVELPSAKTGLADGDKLIREFSFGKQEMRITENGFKSEITLNRIPTLKEARKFIASESGTLSKEYLKSLTTATDANGDVHTFSTLTAFRTWLAKAVFPVVIDPDLNLQPDPTDGLDTFIYQAAATTNYATDARLIIDTNSSLDQRGRGLLKFDVSSIPSGATVSVGSLSLYLNTGQTEDARTLKAHRITANWVEAQVTWNIYSTGNNWSTAGGDYVATETASTSVSTYGAWYAWNILADVQAWVAGTASNYGDIIIGQETESLKRKIFHSSDYATDTSLRPKLAVTYTAAGGTKKFLFKKAGV